MLATDGVWEVMTAQEAVHFVQRWRKRPWQGWNASDALTLEAQERWKLLQEEVGVSCICSTILLDACNYTHRAIFADCKILHLSYIRSGLIRTVRHTRESHSFQRRYLSRHAIDAR